MIIVVLGLVAVLTVPLTGGDLRRLGALPIRHAWAAWVAVGAQTALVWAPDSFPETAAEVAHLATYAVAAWFGWANRRLPGVWIMALGGALNLAAILANGGVMPATPEAWERAGFSLEDGFTNSEVTDDAALWFLGDVFAVPEGWPFANVFSVGDVIVVIGIGWLAHRWCRLPTPSSVPASPVVADLPEHEAVRRRDGRGE